MAAHLKLKNVRAVSKLRADGAGGEDTVGRSAR